MPRENYQDSLSDLRTDVATLGEDVVEQFDRGVAAVADRDAALGREVVAGDQAINDRYLELEAECIDLLALQQPVAGDLRFISASFKILTDLERVGDLATNLGEYAQAADDDDPTDIDVSGIATVCRDQLTTALEAYVEGDAGACRTVADRDDELDALCVTASEQVVRDLIAAEAGTDAWDIEQLMDDVSRLLLTVRDLERVGDHAVNIAARTLYMVEEDPELIY